MKTNYYLAILAAFVCVGICSCSDSDESATGEGEVQLLSFKDSAFEAALIAAGVDTNGDGKISEEEASVVTELNFSGNTEITSTSGLSYFFNLESLDVSYTNITSVSVSGNPLLTYLDCSYSQVGTYVEEESRASVGGPSDVVLEFNPLLKTLKVNNTNIQYLNVTCNPALESADVSYTKVATLNIYHNLSLSSLNLESTNIEALDVSANTALTDLNLKNCESLTSFTYNAETQSLDTFGVTESETLVVNPEGDGVDPDAIYSNSTNDLTTDEFETGDGYGTY